MQKYLKINFLKNKLLYNNYFLSIRTYSEKILFLNDDKNKLYYQVFIEPKQGKYMTSEEEIWKEKFLEQITLKYNLKTVLKAENKNYKLIGLPFFNKENNQKFKEKYDELI